MRLRILIVLALLTCRAFGQADIRYDVQDEIKTDKLNYILERDCVVYSWGADKGELPNLQYHVSILVEGCKQKSFTYEEQDYNENFSFKEYYELSRIVKRVDLQKFKKVGSTSCLMGVLAIDGVYHYFDNPMGDPERDKLQAEILSFLDHAAPKKNRKVTTYTIEGDFEPTRSVTIQQFLNSPVTYDGKRVRVTGYYHSEYEESNFSERKGDAIKQSLSLNGRSTFANDADINWIDDGHVTVEGTFVNRPGGHWGMWPGEIQRLTTFISLDPHAPPPPPANHSSKRRQMNPGPLN